jgi:hypothetical protein
LAFIKTSIYLFNSNIVLKALKKQIAKKLDNKNTREYIYNYSKTNLLLGIRISLSNKL